MSMPFKETEHAHKFLYEMINDDWLKDINVLETQYTKLPRTSVKHYISRMAALNIHTNPFGGDWHFHDTFFGPGRENDYEQLKSRLKVLGVLGNTLVIGIVIIAFLF